MTDKAEEAAEKKSVNFIHAFVDEDLAEGKNEGRIHTRFPPEPNGYLHIGHAKAIHIDFGTAEKYGGKCNLRFDDTNPVKEDVEYIDSIREDIQWLGYNWENREYYTSDYFGKLYDFAIELIKQDWPMSMISHQRIFLLKKGLRQNPEKRALSGTELLKKAWIFSNE